MSNLSTTDVGTLSTRDVGTLSTRDVGTLSTRDVGTSSTRDVGTLSTRDVGTLRTRDIATLTARDVGTLSTRDVGTLSTRDVGTLSTRDIGTLNARDVGTLSTRDVGTLSTRDIGTLSTRDVGTLSTRDVATLSARDVGFIVRAVAQGPAGGDGAGGGGGVAVGNGLLGQPHLQALRVHGGAGGVSAPLDGRVPLVAAGLQQVLYEGVGGHPARAGHVPFGLGHAGALALHGRGDGVHVPRVQRAPRVAGVAVAAAGAELAGGARWVRVVVVVVVVVVGLGGRGRGRVAGAVAGGGGGWAHRRQPPSSPSPRPVPVGSTAGSGRHRRRRCRCCSRRRLSWPTDPGHGHLPLDPDARHAALAPVELGLAVDAAGVAGRRARTPQPRRRRGRLLRGAGVPLLVSRRRQQRRRGPGVLPRHLQAFLPAVLPLAGGAPRRAVGPGLAGAGPGGQRHGLVVHGQGSGEGLVVPVQHLPARGVLVRRLEDAGPLDPHHLPVARVSAGRTPAPSSSSATAPADDGEDWGSSVQVLVVEALHLDAHLVQAAGAGRQAAVRVDVGQAVVVVAGAVAGPVGQVPVLSLRRLPGPCPLQDGRPCLRLGPRLGRRPAQLPLLGLVQLR